MDPLFIDHRLWCSQMKNISFSPRYGKAGCFFLELFIFLGVNLIRRLCVVISISVVNASCKATNWEKLHAYSTKLLWNSESVHIYLGPFFVLRLCWAGKTRMDCRAAALSHSLARILGMSMNAQLWRGFGERKTTRGFLKRGERSWEETWARASECMNFLLFFKRPRRWCLKKTLPTSPVMYTYRKIT